MTSPHIGSIVLRIQISLVVDGIVISLCTILLQFDIVVTPLAGIPVIHIRGCGLS